MVATGMITKEKDQADKRISRVYITGKGQEAYKQVATVWRAMETVVTKGLTATQKDELQELLKLVLRNLG